jgi:phosphoribosylformimino-5-aminoimidazole carboxamide ribotide isomerase
VAVLIPSIDLMGGKIVQLVQGRQKALEFDNFDEWVERFAQFPLVQLIDLDAAIGSGENRSLMQHFLRRLPCQVGGGIRSLASAQEILAGGARRVILGSSLIRQGEIDVAFAKDLAESLGIDKLVFALDARGGRVAIRGWRELTAIAPLQMIERLEPWCAAFLYTHIDSEGLMQGIPRETVRALRAASSRQLIVAGGIASNQEVEELQALGADAVVGMALYMGRLHLSRVAETANRPAAIKQP